MSDIQLLTDQLAGLETKLKGLRGCHDLFKHAQGLLEEAERSAADKLSRGEDLTKIKKDLAELREDKRKALEPVVKALAAKMSTIMPEGKGVFEIGEDGKVFIGWERPDGVCVPYEGLSGGQKVPFDVGLSYALLGSGHKVLLIEAAELDPIHLQALLNHLATNTDDGLQAIVNTYLVPAEVPAAWQLEVIKNEP